MVGGVRLKHFEPNRTCKLESMEDFHITFWVSSNAELRSLGHTSVNLTVLDPKLVGELVRNLLAGERFELIPHFCNRRRYSSAVVFDI